jgi:hypothetical protein
MAGELHRNFLRRTAGILYPDYGAGQVLAQSVSSDYVADAVRRLQRGDTAAAIARLTTVVQARWTGSRYANMDGVLPEVRLVASTGRAALAAAWLDSAFVGLANAPATMFADPIQTGSLVQAMVLRADLAMALGDAKTARHWASAVAILWENPDPGYLPVLTRVRTMTQ